MITYDGTYIKYLLERKGHTLASAARDLGVSRTCVNHVIWGRGTSRRVVEHIERLLGLQPGELIITRATNRKRVA